MKKKYSLVLVGIIGTITLSYSNCAPTHNFKEMELASSAPIDNTPSSQGPVAQNQAPAPSTPPTNPAPAPSPAPQYIPLVSNMLSNEPAGSTVLLDCDMSSRNCNGRLYTAYAGGGVAQLADGAVAYYNQLAINQSNANGAQPAYYPTGSAAAMPEMYVSFRWKMNADFQGGTSIDGNKLFYMRAFENPAGGAVVNGHFAMTGSQYGPWQLAFRPNVDQGTRCARLNRSLCAPNANVVSIERDKWYNVEAYIKASTCATCSDAVVRWWVNGKLVGNYTNLDYGANVINEFVFDQTWDGSAEYQCTSRDCSKEWFHYLDHLHISAPRCAAGGCVLTGQ